VAKITTISVFKNQNLNSGTSCISDKIDLRYIANNGNFALAANIMNGTAATCGTTSFTYSGCALEDGTFITPSKAVAIGTFGTAGRDILTFEPEIMPFIKIIANQTGSTAGGNNSKFDVELIVQ
jgi:hypothetical protein